VVAPKQASTVVGAVPKDASGGVPALALSAIAVNARAVGSSRLQMPPQEEQQQQQQQQQQQHLGVTEAVDLTGEDSEPETNTKLEPAAVASAGAPATATAAPAAAAADLPPAATAGALAAASGHSTGVPPPAAAVAGSFTLQRFNPSNLPGALAQLMLLLDHMAAADELVERLEVGVDALTGLAAGDPQLLMFAVPYASVQLWARRGRFDKVQDAVDAMLRGLGV
jgi:hypothetical protein